MTQRILLDTDLGMGSPGSDIDDGFALALALAEPEIEVDTVTTVNGNTDVDTATRLSVELLERLGRADVPVVRGSAAPLVRPGRGFATSRYDPPGTDPLAPAGVHAAVRIVERVMAEPGELTLVAIGPLTNVAMALALEPRVATSVRRIVVMGGVYLEQTNVAAIPGEFNFWVDPEAAARVADSGASLRFVGLDVTRRVRLTHTQADRLAEDGGDFAGFAARCTHEWIDHLERASPGDPRERGSCALHDPLAVAVVAHPNLVSWRPARLAVETSGEHTRGVAVADLLTGRHPPTANCEIAVAVDADAVTELFLDRMRSLT